MDYEGKRHFEDMEVGDTHDCGSIEVTREEMLKFAERYDPQPIHADEEAAGNSMFGDIIASGWLTCSLSARLLVKELNNAMIGGRGLDEVRWHQPVYAGTEISVEVELVDKYEGDNPLFGHTKANVTTTDEGGNDVLTMYILGLVKKRDS